MIAAEVRPVCDLPEVLKKKYRARSRTGTGCFCFLSDTIGQQSHLEHDSQQEQEKPLEKQQE